MSDGHITEHPEMRGRLEFKNVSFKYPDAENYILNDISFDIQRGETLAILGGTGCGKTTLVNLINRFYDVESGEILIDGINVKDYTRETLNSKLGYVPQKAVLLSGSVHDNVAYGNSNGSTPNHDDVVSAVQVAQAERFVLDMDNQYQAEVARGGNNLSGGQKQRLQIARAIARQPEFYIFDDSFSALDYKTDANLRKELKKHSKDITNIIVSQRISTIRYAEKIIVLEEGHIVGAGKHNELLDTCPTYRSMAEAQLRKEELFNETQA
jgi:ATP-binding cassette subfamily B protein